MRASHSSDPLGAATARAQFEAPRTINAPLFRSLLDRLADDRRWVVLDLGAARPQTLDLLHGTRCRIDIADLADAAGRALDGDATVRFADLDAALQPIRKPEPTDIVFCWDLLNYLELDALRTLMARIAARCSDGALIHALIVYSERMMQGSPGQFVPLDEGHLLNLSDAEPSRSAPRYSPDDFRKCMPDYAIDRVRLLSNGMQEYLFRLASTRPQDRSRAGRNP